MKNTKFKISDIPSGIGVSSTIIYVFSFRPLSNLGMENHYIFSNSTGTRAVSINKSHLDIWGTTSPQLKYEKNDWNYMLVQYSRVTTYGKNDDCFFILNGKKGSFAPNVYDFLDNELFIGGPPGRKTAPIVLASFEVYLKVWTPPETPESYLLPKEIYTPLLDHLTSRIIDW